MEALPLPEGFRHLWWASAASISTFVGSAVVQLDAWSCNCMQGSGTEYCSYAELQLDVQLRPIGDWRLRGVVEQLL